MKYLLPKTLSSFPLYIFFYWVSLWGFVTLLTFFAISQNTTPDKKYVELYDNRYYYAPVQQELKNRIINSGIVIGFGTNLIGYSWMLYAWKKKILKEA